VDELPEAIDAGSAAMLTVAGPENALFSWKRLHPGRKVTRIVGSKT
jgi:hypothetical protein